MIIGARGAAICATTLILVCSPWSPGAIAAPALRSADIRIVITSRDACDVTMGLTVEGASEIDHRVEAFDGEGLELVSIAGAQQVGDLRTVGRTRSLVLRPDRASYEIRYRTRHADARRNRCPMWTPAAPADGQSRAVRLQIDLPAGAVPWSSMPAFTWTGTHGAATLGHIPSFVSAAFGAADEARGWDAGRVMDAATITVFGGASAWWLWRRRR